MRGAHLLGTPPLSQTVSEVVLIWISAGSFHIRIQIEIASCIKFQELSLFLERQVKISFNEIIRNAN